MKVVSAHQPFGNVSPIPFVQVYARLLSSRVRR